jgi:hypothetical protein
MSDMPSVSKQVFRLEFLPFALPALDESEFW